MIKAHCTQERRMNEWMRENEVNWLVVIDMAYVVFCTLILGVFVVIPPLLLYRFSATVTDVSIFLYVRFGSPRFERTDKWHPINCAKYVAAVRIVSNHKTHSQATKQISFFFFLFCETESQFTDEESVLCTLNIESRFVFLKESKFLNSINCGGR